MVPQLAACQIVVSFTERHATLSNLHILKIWKCDYFKFLYLKNNFWLCLFPDKFYIPVFSFCCSLVGALSFVCSKLPGGVFPSPPPSPPLLKKKTYLLIFLAIQQEWLNSKVDVCIKNLQEDRWHQCKSVSQWRVMKKICSFIDMWLARICDVISAGTIG